MKVKELIEKLQEYDKDKEVWIDFDDDERKVKDVLHDIDYHRSFKIADRVLLTDWKSD